MSRPASGTAENRHLPDRFFTTAHHVRRAALAAALVLLYASAAPAGQNRLTDIRSWTSPTFTRVVLDLKEETAWESQVLKDPDRVTVELKGFEGHVPKGLLEVNDGIVNKVRILQSSSGQVRIIIELAKAADHKIFILKKVGDKPPRLVIDVTRTDLEQADRVQREQTARQKKKGDYIVVVDPGHGGEDPGALGRGGMQEKDLVLTIGRQIAAKLSALPGIKAYLTRRGDYFIPLRKRVEIAKEYGADLFLSMHVNAGFTTKAAGSSIYCLSFKGATSNVARMAEERENASDSIGGVPLDQQSPSVSAILYDMVQTHTINSSVRLATLLLDDIGRFNKLYLASPQEANFAVLRAPDVPSLLIETDFISTPDRAKMLRSEDFQARFARTVAGTVAAYLAGRQPRAAAALQAQPEAQPEPAGGAVKDTAAKKETQPAEKKAAPPPKPAAPALPAAPEGGRYRVVKKSDTQYALVPVAASSAQPAPVPAAPAKKSAPAAQPAPAAPVTVVITHVVQKGESLSLIAQKYQIPFTQLCRQNSLPLTAKARAGMKLKIVKQKPARP